MTSNRGWETVVILKTNVSVQDVYHGMHWDGLTRCGRRVNTETQPRWRWQTEGWSWVRPCARCFPDE